MSVEDKPVHVYSESKRTVTVKSTEPETKENTSKQPKNYEEVESRTPIRKEDFIPPSFQSTNGNESDSVQLKEEKTSEFEAPKAQTSLIREKLENMFKFPTTEEKPKVLAKPAISSSSGLKTNSQRLCVRGYA